MSGEKNTGSGHRIAAIAGRQHGAISTLQLRECGVNDEMISTRAKAGDLHRVFRGVYAVGHRDIGVRGVMHAAVLACGRNAVISHESAAELLGLWDRHPALVHVTGSGQTGRKIQGVRWHRASVLEPGEVVIHDGIRCTSTSRTLVDLSGRYRETSLRRLIEQAAVLRLLDVDAIDRILSRDRRRGAPLLRQLLTPWRRKQLWQPRLRTPIEARMLAAVVEARLPCPRTNVTLCVDGHRLEVDLLWEKQRVVIETDGEQTHGTRSAFRRDRWRDQILTAAGYRTARVTWDQLEDELEAVLARVRRMLSGDSAT